MRDLFRWAKRYTLTDTDSGLHQDWKQYLAEQGFLLLSSRCRAEQDILTIHQCIQSVFKKKIDLNFLDSDAGLSPLITNELKQIMQFSAEHFPAFVWTTSARRVALLAGLAYRFNEPFLLIGETGLGKTTICQMLSAYHGKHLHIINCHMHSEAADFLGSMRPVRQTEIKYIIYSIVEYF